MSEIVKLSDVIQHFDDDGTPFADFRGLTDRDLFATRAQAFENDKGPGVMIWINMDGGDAPEVRICSHAIGIVESFSDSEIQDLIAAGNLIKFQIHTKVSKKSGREFYYCD